MLTNFKIEVKWAFIFTLMTLVWMVMEKAVGLHDQYLDKHMIYTNLIAIPAVAIYVFALLEKKRKFYLDDMDFKKGLKCGLVMTLIIAILAPFTQYIISTYITPEYFQNVIKLAVEKKMMTQVQAEEYFSLKNYMKQSAYGALVMGVITSAIVAAIVRTKQKKLTTDI